MVAEGQQQIHHAHVIIAAQGRVLGLQHGQVAFKKAIVRGEDLRIALFPEPLWRRRKRCQTGRAQREASAVTVCALAKGHDQINGFGFTGSEMEGPKWRTP